MVASAASLLAMVGTAEVFMEMGAVLEETRQISRIPLAAMINSRSTMRAMMAIQAVQQDENPKPHHRHRQPEEKPRRPRPQRKRSQKLTF